MDKSTTSRGRTGPASAPGPLTPVARPERNAGLGADFDVMELAKGHTHHMADRGIFTITLPDGSKVAWNTKGPHLDCPTCKADPTRQAGCPECSGRGKVQSVPFCERPWDEAVPGLFVGGHESQTGDCHVTDQFDVVISLHKEEGFGPDVDVAHHTHTMIDGPLDPADHQRLNELAEIAARAVRRGDKVLVRCHAGMNRSALVAGMAMIKLGWNVDDAVARMRDVRSHWVLFNDDFVSFLHAFHHQTRQEGTAASTAAAECSGCHGAGGSMSGACWDCQGGTLVD